MFKKSIMLVVLLVLVSNVFGVVRCGMIIGFGCPCRHVILLNMLRYPSSFVKSK